MLQGNFKILYNRKVGPEYFKMAIYAPGIVKEASPGQFVHLRCQGSADPLLRRPFSFHRFNHGGFEILYKVVGRGTNVLAKKRKGDKIDILGPLGNGFDLARDTRYEIPSYAKASEGRRDTFLVAGGMGVAPLLALAEKLAYSVERIADRNRIAVLLGAKTKQAILCASDFKKLNLKVQIATDDGSLGFKGFVTGLLKKILRTTNNEQRTTVYACGSHPMLQEVAWISRDFRISGYASLEEKMACGVGACLGCAISTREGYKRVCKDGPIFNLQEIKW